jgi:branched-chain amino acid transport system permease protein
VKLLVQEIVDGIATGAIYGILALALVIIYRSTSFINFAQGEMAMVSTFLAWQLTQWNVGVVPAILISIGLAFVGGMLIQAAVIRPMEGAPELALVIVTVGLFLGINQMTGLIWGHEVKSFPSAFPDEVLSIAGARIGVGKLGVLAVLLVEIGLLYGILLGTRFGLAMRAVAVNLESSELVGIPTRRIVMLAWGIATALGAVAGAMVAPQLFLWPGMMFPVLIYSMAAATLGGFDSPLGAVLAGLILGVVENLAGTYITIVGPDLKIAVALLVIVIVLLVRPSGLFGSHVSVRV